MSVKNKTIKKNKSKKNIEKITKNYENEIIINFMVFLNTVKLFHWKTFQYSIHKATDELYSKLGANFDRYVEVLLGKNTRFSQNTISLSSKKSLRFDLSNVRSIPLHSFSDIKPFLDEVERFKEYIMRMEDNQFFKVMSNQDLITIRDEIMADLNQFLYLSTLN